MIMEQVTQLLRNRIQELEKTERYLQQQLRDTETEREKLHVLARKDKGLIHEQNVRLQELILDRHSLRTQLIIVEKSERASHMRCTDLEDQVFQLEDRVGQLQIQEKRLRDQIHQLTVDSKTRVAAVSFYNGENSQPTSSLSLFPTLPWHAQNISQDSMASTLEHQHYQQQSLQHPREDLTIHHTQVQVTPVPVIQQQQPRPHPLEHSQGQLVPLIPPSIQHAEAAASQTQLKPETDDSHHHHHHHPPQRPEVVPNNNQDHQKLDGWSEGGPESQQAEPDEDDCQKSAAGTDMVHGQLNNDQQHAHPQQYDSVHMHEGWKPGEKRTGEQPEEQQPGEQQHGEQQHGEQQQQHGEQQQQPGEQQHGEQQHREQQPGEQQPAEQQPGEQQHGEQLPGEQQQQHGEQGQQPGEQQPGEQQPGEQQHGEQQHGEQQPGEQQQQPGEQQPGEQQQGEQQHGEQQQGEQQQGEQQQQQGEQQHGEQQPGEQQQGEQQQQQGEQQHGEQQQGEQQQGEQQQGEQQQQQGEQQHGEQQQGEQQQQQGEQQQQQGEKQQQQGEKQQQQGEQQQGEQQPGEQQQGEQQQGEQQQQQGEQQQGEQQQGEQQQGEQHHGEQQQGEQQQGEQQQGEQQHQHGQGLNELHFNDNRPQESEGKGGGTVKPAVPEPPGQLRVERAEGSCLLLAWQPPVLDAQGCSNGARVVGYRIYLNGRVCQQPHNPRLSSATIQVPPRRDPRRPHRLAMETLAACGGVSARVELIHHHHHHNTPVCGNDPQLSFRAVPCGAADLLVGLNTL